MKLWLVMYVTGKVAGSWGPLPYEMPECLVHERDMTADIQRSFAHPKPGAVETWKKLGVAGAEDFRIACEVRAERPVIDFEAPK